ncbi:MAG: OmpH family outer membrane protein [Bdellovibrionales bacterium]|nr:OmpH family outer membrane protein [Bdellovibrionales bacterium]
MQRGLVGVLGLVLSVSLMASRASAEGEKIGVVDMQKALQTVDAGKKAKSQLEKEFNAKKKELESEESAIKKMGEEFKKQSLVLNDEARAKKQGEIQEKIFRFQEKTQKSQLEIQQKEQELTAPILKGIRAAIAETAKKKNYTIILEKNENNVLYFNEKEDLTQEVIKAYK